MPGMVGYSQGQHLWMIRVKMEEERGSVTLELQGLCESFSILTGAQTRMLCGRDRLYDWNRIHAGDGHGLPRGDPTVAKGKEAGGIRGDEEYSG